MIQHIINIEEQAQNIVRAEEDAAARQPEKTAREIAKMEEEYAARRNHRLKELIQKEEDELKSGKREADRAHQQLMKRLSEAEQSRLDEWAEILARRIIQDEEGGGGV